MPNEAILIISLIVIYSAVVLFYKLFGRAGLYAYTVLASISANIEVLILVDAFGMRQTLGNVLFASTFLTTDILSETEGKKYADKAVLIGIASSILFVFISQSWLLYTPCPADLASAAIHKLFANTPRLIGVSIAVYAIVQFFDVYAYHAIWNFTAKHFGSRGKGLWIRNNLSTLTSQLLNTVLFNFAAFWGIYDFKTIISIALSSYVIFIFTSLLDTPAIYIAARGRQTAPPALEGASPKD